jgi:hypothetical protein
VEDGDKNRAVPFMLETYSKIYCSIARISLKRVWLAVLGVTVTLYFLVGMFVFHVEKEHEE